MWLKYSVLHCMSRKKIDQWFLFKKLSYDLVEMCLKNDDIFPSFIIKLDIYWPNGETKTPVVQNTSIIVGPIFVCSLQIRFYNMLQKIIGKKYFYLLNFPQFVKKSIFNCSLKNVPSNIIIFTSQIWKLKPIFWEIQVLLSGQFLYVA